MSDNTSPATTPAATSASWRDWAYLYLAQLKEMATNAGAAIVAKVKKRSPLAQTSVTLVFVLGAAWLLFHWPSQPSFETAAAVDAKIASLKADLDRKISQQHDALTSDISKLPSADDIAKVTAGMAEFVQLQTVLQNLQARVKKLEAEVAAQSSRVSYKRRSR